MVTITTTVSPTIEGAGSDGTVELVSAAAATADSVVITGSPIPWWMPHAFLSVKMYDVSGGEIVDSAGTFAVTVKTRNNSQFEAIEDGASIDATAPTTSSWQANTAAVSVVPSMLADTVTWKVFMTFNRG
jgi:hypothetical protein